VQSRSESIRAIRNDTFDVCVIGGGATGAGCALEAQLRGLRTVLIDAGDFASATSSASTKLVHGGIRYLERGLRQFDLGQLKVVRQALHERVHMLRNAPYLAHPRQFLIPCSSRVEKFYYGLGLRLYDAFSGASNLAPSRALSRQETLDELPELNSSGLSGSVVYTDGQFDDARYGLALVESFSALGGRAGNYLKLLSFDVGKEGRLTSASVEDRHTQGTFVLRARVFLNATGPYSDGIRRLASAKAAPRLVLSRGVHILLPLISEKNEPALLVPRTEDGRVIFAIPWLGRMLVGTTDQEVSDPGDLPVTREEAEYLLGQLNRQLGQRRGLGEIVSAFSGVRPLIQPAHARQTKQLIRDHEVEVDLQSGLISILGGKWTTYRAMAEDAVNHIERRLGRPVTRSRSVDHLLAGSAGYSTKLPAELSMRHDLSPLQGLHLTNKFGDAADEVCAIAQREPALRRRVVDGFPAIEAEITYSIRYEMAMTIEDVLARRLGLQSFSWELSLTAARKVGEHFGRECGWSARECSGAVEEYSNRIRERQRVLGLVTGPANDFEHC
jgi:glycerol-3-phosphate dehydrogenase